ncbi:MULTISPECIES: hypothetical protein [unclassified Arcicella]|uniref:hypothetical protein n=1 Tax=unclassified Arcicella TaxID=2644986 RepID=UPI0028578531|nr:MULTISPECIES: hypothetical protein [unclassified Arcicella]MDR6563571.1 hypothetical protein [Arcicella sp. BE51]MDR6813317.1 hypothetical protein [Arcicella sp. BE140]MDR6824631.1 hypothetical protein [Arcicella sp. BE139]
MEILVVFCGIHFLCRSLLRQAKKFIGFDYRIALILTFLLSVMLTFLLKFEQNSAEYPFFTNLPTLFYLIFNFRLITIFSNKYSDTDSFAFDDLESGSYLTYWLSELDKNLWKVGILSILIKNFFEHL